MAPLDTITIALKVRPEPRPLLDVNEAIVGPRVHEVGSGPPDSTRGGYGAIAMKDALEATMGSMPAGLLRSLTWDRGKEPSTHTQFTFDAGIRVSLADSHSPCQRATNENTNGLLRQYFPKGTALSRLTLEDRLAVQDVLNSRPRKALGWKTLAEALDEQLRSLQHAGVATTG